MTINTSGYIEKVLTLSTAHMPCSIPDFYDLRACEFTYGYVVWAIVDPGDDECDSQCGDCNGLDKTWIGPILKLAFEQKCRLILFDADADKLDGLESWEW